MTRKRACDMEGHLTAEPRLRIGVIARAAVDDKTVDRIRATAPGAIVDTAPYDLSLREQGEREQAPYASRQELLNAELREVLAHADVLLALYTPLQLAELAP